MPTSLIKPKNPFQIWKAGESHQPISPAGTVAYNGVSPLYH